jgi:drug/metabolite transporter (DMT)-like permease
MYVVSDVVLETIPPFTLLLLRLLLGVASLALMAFLVAPRGTLRYTRSQAWSLLGIGLVGYGFSLGFQFFGTRLSTAANGALITSASPAFILIFAYWLLREQLTKARMAALTLATVGVVIVVFDPNEVRLGADVFWGNLALFGAAVTWGLYSVQAKQATTTGLNSVAISALAPAGGLAVAVPLAAWELTLGGETVKAITPGIVGGVLFLGIVSTAIAVYLWTKAFEILEASVASLLFFAQPVVGAILSAWLLKEPLGAQFFGGGAMILLGVLLASLPARPGRGNETPD